MDTAGGDFEANDALTRDERVFASMFSDHYDRVHAYVARRAGPDAADEIAAETFVVAWRRLADVPGEPLPWLIVVARNTLSDFRRSTYRRNLLAEELGRLQHLGPDRSDPSDAVAERLAVLTAIAQLAEPDRELVLLIAWDGLSHREAARVCGCSVPTLRVRLHRLRKRLAVSIDGDEAVPTPHSFTEPLESR